MHCEAFITFPDRGRTSGNLSSTKISLISSEIADFITLSNLINRFQWFFALPRPKINVKNKAYIYLLIISTAIGSGSTGSPGSIDPHDPHFFKWRSRFLAVIFFLQKLLRVATACSSNAAVDSLKWKLFSCSLYTCRSANKYKFHVIYRFSYVCDTRW